MPRPTKSPYITTRRSVIHNVGVFASRDIPKGTDIIEYVGRKVNKAKSKIIQEKTERSGRKDPKKGLTYIFILNKKFDIDGNVSWNTAKYINHSCDPNCETDIVKGRIWVIALRDIKKAEELSYNYGYDLEEFINHSCKCGTKRCVGYILEEKLWRKIPNFLSLSKSNNATVNK